jgi:indole-3-glycerol phosphate synthase
VKVAESGIAGLDDVERFAAEGARAVLVGEALVKDGDPESAVRAMSRIPTSATRAGGTGDDTGTNERKQEA